MGMNQHNIAVHLAPMYIYKQVRLSPTMEAKPPIPITFFCFQRNLTVSFFFVSVHPNYTLVA